MLQATGEIGENAELREFSLQRPRSLLVCRKHAEADPRLKIPSVFFVPCCSPTVLGALRALCVEKPL
jgi:hypothetical protein